VKRKDRIEHASSSEKERSHKNGEEEREEASCERG